VPDKVFVHGFITVSGEKMSKSRGTGISPLRYLEIGMNAEWLRYYIAAKLNSHVEDIEFNPDDFIARVNSDLIGKYVNIASRASTFVQRHFGGALSAAGQAIIEFEGDAARTTGEIAALLDAREYGKALRLAMEFADRVNQAFDGSKPWELAKHSDEASRQQLHDVCSMALRGFEYLTMWLKPVLPLLAAQAELFLGTGPLAWSLPPPQLEKLRPYKHLMQRVEARQLDTLFEPTEAAEDGAAAAAETISLPLPGGEAIAPTITIDDFARLDLRIAKIVACEKVEGSTSANPSCAPYSAASSRPTRPNNSSASSPSWSPISRRAR
jgi:methionyl-tRNA synthetase